MQPTGWITTISVVTNLYLCLCVRVCRCVCLPMPGPWLLLHSLHIPVLFSGLPVLLLLCVLGAVHPNMALLLTGITSVRSASTRSRATAWPWGTIPHNHRRKLTRPGLMVTFDSEVLILWINVPSWTCESYFSFWSVWYRKISLKRRKMTHWTLNREYWVNQNSILTGRRHVNIWDFFYFFL